MNRDMLLSFASMATQQFAARAAEIPYATFLTVCQMRLAHSQGRQEPIYAVSPAAYESMVRQAYAIHKERAAQIEEALHAKGL